MDDGDVQREAADELQRPQAGHMLVAAQPPLQELLVGQHEDGAVPTREVGRHLEELHLWLGAGSMEQNHHRRMNTHTHTPCHHGDADSSSLIRGNVTFHTAAGDVMSLLPDLTHTHTQYVFLSPGVT